MRILYAQQELFIAAVLSNDPNMIEAYQSGDPYLAFAKLAGAVPADATKETHGNHRHGVYGKSHRFYQTSARRCKTILRLVQYYSDASQEPYPDRITEQLGPLAVRNTMML